MRALLLAFLLLLAGPIDDIGDPTCLVPFPFHCDPPPRR